MLVNLYEVETAMLVEELAKRTEVQLFSCGIYKMYDAVVTDKYRGSKKRVPLPTIYKTLIIGLPD